MFKLMFLPESRSKKNWLTRSLLKCGTHGCFFSNSTREHSCNLLAKDCILTEMSKGEQPEWVGQTF